MDPDRLRALCYRLSSPKKQVDAELLNANRDAWRSNHESDISTILSTAFEAGDLKELKLIRDDVHGFIFPRLCIFAAVCHENSAENVRSALHGLWALQRTDPAVKLTSYRQIKGILISMLPSTKDFEAQYNKIRDLDVIHIGAEMLHHLPVLNSTSGARLDLVGLVNLFQGVLDFEKLDPVRPTILRALTEVSRETTVCPEALVHKSVKNISNYVVGVGGFSDVWKGELYSEPVAIKVMRCRTYKLDEMNRAMKDYSREAMIWSQLHHPNILPFYGIYYWATEPDKLRISLLSPWMENGDISKYLKQNINNSELDRLPLVVDIAKGLEYLHNFKPPVIHGDLKPDNILITESGTACISDFGLGRWAQRSDDSEISSLQGCQWYWAPELFGTDDIGTSKPPCPESIGAQPKRTIQTDIYAFACVCYEIYDGQLRSMRMAFTRKNPCPRPKILQDNLLWQCINRMWSRDPSKRPLPSQFVFAFEERRRRPVQHWWPSGPVVRLRSNTFSLNARHPIDTALEYQPDGNMETIVESPIQTNSCSTPVQIIPSAEKENIREKDVVIALLGATGTGRSKFINCAFNVDVAKVSNSVVSCTQTIQVFGCYHPTNPSRRVFLVDTPGLEHTSMSDENMLEILAKWLAQTYKRKIRLSGVIVFHRITQAPFPNLLVVSTGWGELDNDSEGDEREEDLRKDFLSDATAKGCGYMRFSRPNFENAWIIIDHFKNEKRALEIQVEIVEKKRKWRETNAFKVLSNWLDIFRPRPKN
ncbi:kinase-like protein [Coprinopsis marcescibilis]|uniref:Kinase-like protein n=1 Tax=Coprinopsis marcescibilis TaxID=230819 RepID=A0A5C3KKZ2_COPMA|nr:kinase-like protein [Coprinopsis marcescibilis]